MAHLVDPLLPTPEVRGSNRAIGKCFEESKVKRKERGNDRIFKLSLSLLIFFVKTDDALNEGEFFVVKLICFLTNFHLVNGDHQFRQKGLVQCGQIWRNFTNFAKFLISLVIV